MSLTELWSESREQLLDKRVNQVIAFAGSGRLTDESTTSKEFRDFLNQVSSSVLGGYAEDCLRESFPDSGLALQDIINQVGRRLGLAVTDGKYRGKRGQTGEDGIWRLPDGHAIVLEVKTTDTYRIDLDHLADFRKLLSQANVIDPSRSSYLVVVGRQDTGDLEAQIRGSRHAWDFRIISVEALLRLMSLKESIEDPTTLSRIHAILIPQEFTRLDGIVDILFSTAEEVTQVDVGVEEPDTPSEGEDENPSTHVPKFTPVRFHDACIARIEAELKMTLVKRTRTTFESPDSSTRLTCAVSRQYASKTEEGYWFAFFPYHLEFIKGASRSFAAFGCGSEHKLFLIPAAELETWLTDAYVTKNDGRFYWHVQLYNKDGKWSFRRRRGKGNIDVTHFLLPSPAGG